MEQTFFLDTPIGGLEITVSSEAVTAIRFCGKTAAKAGAKVVAPRPAAKTGVAKSSEASPLLMQAARELTEYFAGTRRDFSFPVAPAGTPFQQAVWQALRTIPCGQTRTYKQIAEQIGRPAACRAVGMANNRNPIPIIIPCHRVVGSDGKLVGYAGGLDTKRYLLELEK